MHNRDFTGGIILIAVGVILLLSNLGIISGWRELWRDWWPVVIIVIGLSMLIKRGRE